MSVPPAIPVASGYDPNNVYGATNPRKRPHVDFTPDTSVKSPTYQLAKVVIERIHRADVICPPSSPSKNYSRALQKANAFDAIFSLTPSKTLVEQRPN